MNRSHASLLVGALACTVSTTAAAVDDGARLAATRQKIAQLEARVEQAEAIRAIKRVQHAYGQYAEAGLWHDLADLFADNAIGHYPAGVLTGNDSIRKLFLQDVGQGRLGLADGRFYPHIVLQPVVTVEPDGKTAKGRWRVFAMLGGYGASASWVGGIYENEYVKENGAWKISELRYFTEFSGSYERGWTEVRAPRAGQPPSDICENYLVSSCVIPFHYDPTRAGTPIPAALARPRGATPGSTDLASLRNRLSDLARRVQRMNDESAVINLQHSYGYYVDRKMWDDVADLFAGDGTLELGQQGVYVGKASVRRALNQFGPQGLREGELNDHLQLQTIVTVAPDGGSAKARGVEFSALSVTDQPGHAGRGGQWREGVFENEYVKQGGVWKIKSVHVYPLMITDYDKGWGKDAQPAPGPSQSFPPDRPPTEVYQIYPKAYIPRFHYVNPVTGRPAQYPAGVSATEQSPSRERAGASTATGKPVRTIAELGANLAEAERALDVATAYDGAENVANAYSYYIDEFQWDNTADLFAANAWKELSGVGVYVGRERIRQSLKDLYPGNGRPKNFFAIHQTTQPVIHVTPDGRAAKIRVRLFQATGRAGEDGSWTAGVYENQAVKENGVWKLSAMDLDYTWTASYVGGWARVTGEAAHPAAPALSFVSQFPPDRPLRGPALAPFPKVSEPAFHYRNPVSGRAPAVLLP